MPLWAETQISSNIGECFSNLHLLVFLFLVLRILHDNDCLQLILQNVYLHLLIDFSFLLMVLVILKTNFFEKEVEDFFNCLFCSFSFLDEKNSTFFLRWTSLVKSFN